MAVILYSEAFMSFLQRDQFIRTNLFICLFGMSMRCYRTVHISADLGSWLNSPMFWAP